MPLPVSRTQFNKLGERLAAAETVPDEDYELLKQALGSYEEAQLAALDRLRELGFTATGRTKSTGTLIDKVRRHRTRLSTMQDLAGARLVVEGSRLAQDEAVLEIVSGFSNADKPPEVDDRRSAPSSGYRAVHVIVTVDDLPVEIQVRTELQDLWAQAYERLGDRWGRAIRYGGEPDDPQAPATPYSNPAITRAMIIRYMQALSEQIDNLELASVNIVRIEAMASRIEDRDSDEYQAMLTDLLESKEGFAALEEELRGTLRTLVRYATEVA